MNNDKVDKDFLGAKPKVPKQKREGNLVGKIIAQSFSKISNIGNTGQTKQQDFSSEIKNLRAQLEEVYQENRGLKEENQKLKSSTSDAQCKKLREQAKVLADDKSILAEILQEVEVQNEEQITQIHGLHNQIVMRDHTIGDLRAQITCLDQNLQKVSEELEAWEAQDQQILQQFFNTDPKDDDERLVQSRKEVARLEERILVLSNESDSFSKRLNDSEIECKTPDLT
jgi:chromosome segregation ATPase